MKTLKPFHVWFVSFALFTTMASCVIVDSRSIAGDGNIVTDTLALERFENIDLGGMFNVTLTRGNNPQVIIETDSNLMELVNVQVKAGTLTISTRNDMILRPTRSKLTITYPELTRVSIRGAGSLSSTEPVESRELTFDISGAGEIDLVVDARILRTNLSGAGDLRLEGEAGQHFVDLSGASHLQSANLITRETLISLSGAGSAEVYATDLLNASLTGVGSIRYYGSPAQKTVTRTGIGTIRSGN
jgi:hypothetical protein